MFYSVDSKHACTHTDIVSVAGGVRLVSFNKLWLVCRKGSCLSLCPECLIEMDRTIPHMAAENEQNTEVCKCLSVAQNTINLPFSLMCRTFGELLQILWEDCGILSLQTAALNLKFRLWTGHSACIPHKSKSFSWQRWQHCAVQCRLTEEVNQHKWYGLLC